MVLTACAAIKHFYSLRYPGKLFPTDLKSVARVVRGLERATRKPSKKKEGVHSDLMSQMLNFLLPNGLENCCLFYLRNAADFSVLFYASARFSDIVSMNINYVRFIEYESVYAILGSINLKTREMIVMSVWLTSRKLTLIISHVLKFLRLLLN